MDGTFCDTSNSNVSAPLNVSGTNQTKTGSITASSLSAPQHCIGASCITAWPAADRIVTTNGYQAVMQTDGNMVVYNGGTACWSSKGGATGSCGYTNPPATLAQSSCYTIWPPHNTAARCAGGYYVAGIGSAGWNKHGGHEVYATCCR